MADRVPLGSERPQHPAPGALRRRRLRALAIGTVDRVAFHEVANALDPANATPSGCASAVTG
ncbi:hypothetical protein GCM10020221_30300 [Streptomyces thioluteus]|uniref:Uncharacterized protein n=1 Tax=Streptomyces thioluteus TaxID=66431 RepID=A0ABN3WYX8_STRTU